MGTEDVRAFLFGLGAFGVVAIIFAANISLTEASFSLFEKAVAGASEVSERTPMDKSLPSTSSSSGEEPETKV